MSRRQSPPRPPRRELPPFTPCGQPSRSGHPCGRIAGHTGAGHVCRCEAERALEMSEARRGAIRDGQPTENGEEPVSTTNDTYEAGLIAAMHALDALADVRKAEAAALDSTVTGEGAYDSRRHTEAAYRYTGIVDAYGLIAGMVSDYRKAVA